MDKLDRSLINEYNHIGRRIAAIKQQASGFEYAFWHQSFMGCSLALDENGNRLSAPNVEKLVIRLVSIQETNQLATDALTFKQRQYRRYLSTLSDSDRLAIVQPSTAPADLLTATLDEIREIEEAASWRFGWLVDQHISSSEPVTGFSSRIRDVLAALKQNGGVSDNETNQAPRNAASSDKTSQHQTSRDEHSISLGLWQV
ncbi:hypothetical protein [Lacticaseibacillus rhamnosus]|uniref:hypothetical protein n=1 Tax=Lacticaseibacillus rhamnosus TaxID=47715 RepID=UPI00237FCA48|nr:hypothetical protein [Lacticaseibacillus rhamnosus]MDE3295718.1 hypothetical protein [Lacticaseibacillus rhamnosus]